MRKFIIFPQSCTFFAFFKSKNMWWVWPYHLVPSYLTLSLGHSADSPLSRNFILKVATGIQRPDSLVLGVTCAGRRWGDFPHVVSLFRSAGSSCYWKCQVRSFGSTVPMKTAFDTLGRSSELWNTRKRCLTVTKKKSLWRNTTPPKLSNYFERQFFWK